jgi:hypothetical protein
MSRELYQIFFSNGTFGDKGVSHSAFFKISSLSSLATFK